LQECIYTIEMIISVSTPKREMRASLPSPSVDIYCRLADPRNMHDKTQSPHVSLPQGPPLIAAPEP